MGKTKFKPVDPKQDFVQMEKTLLEYWYQKGIVKKYLQKNNGAKQKFSFLDGPITANNPMGVHHAWGRTYKDLWQRFYNMHGFAQRFQNGFDEQGLWIEVEVEKGLGFKNKKDIEKYGIDKFIEKCKQRVKTYAKIQTEQSKRLGYFMDWENSYHTSSEENNYAIWHFLKVCNQKGYLYKGRDSVPWCPRCGTAISQHEILTEEYQEIVHKAVFVKYKLSENDENLLVWTTTPWTLPSNVAVALNPDFTYALYQNKNTGEKIIFLRSDLIKGLKRDLKKELFEDEIENWKCIKDYKGSQLVGKKYLGNFDKLPALAEVEHKVVAAKDLVNAEEGTGLVHIAPGAGEQDFHLAKEKNLSVVASIDEAANYIEGFGTLSGKNAKENPDLIIDQLRTKEVLFKVQDYKHRYPTCWRCKTELVWRVVDEWYIAMDKKDPSDKKDRTLRQEMVAVAKKISWIPKFGLERELDWLKNMHDWLISKKRYWGLTLPIWECANCEHFEVIGSKQELKQKAAEGWDKFEGKSPHRPQVDEVKIKCPNCKSTMSRVADVGNVWLDAGIVPTSTMPSDWFPADFITESFPGQFKNWFYSLIAMSTVLKNAAPFKTVLGFATLLDEKGQEMHKSKGNAIEFNEAADKISVDVMRWLYARQNPAANLLFGYHKADDVRRRFYLILYNSYKYFVDYANLASWNPNESSHSISTNILDSWIEAKINLLSQEVNTHLKNYDAAQAARLIEDFVAGDLSTWYIRRSRSRVGPNAEKSDQNVFLKTLQETLVTVAKLLAPFTPFISDEIYQNLTKGESVHLTQYPLGDKVSINKGLIDQMNKARDIAEKAHALRKKAQIKVRQPLQKLEYSGKKLESKIEKIIAEEINVKQLVNAKAFNLDTKITPELKAQGQMREIIRRVQQARKEANCELHQKVTVELPDWPKEYEYLIKKETLAASLVKRPILKIVK